MRILGSPISLQTKDVDIGVMMFLVDTPLQIWILFIAEISTLSDRFCRDVVLVEQSCFCDVTSDTAQFLVIKNYYCRCKPDILLYFTV